MRKHVLTVLAFLLSIALAADCHGQGLRDVKGPVAFPPNFFLLYGLPAAVILLSGLLLFRRFFKGVRPMRVKEPVPELPWIVAFRRLEALKKRNLPQSGKVKEYYTELSDIVRRYLEDRFRIKAPEMTTEEFLYSLKGSRDLGEGHQQLLEGFMNSCDMVKFAKYGPSVAEMEEGFASAQKLIGETKLSGQEKGTPDEL